MNSGADTDNIQQTDELSRSAKPGFARNRGLQHVAAVLKR